MATPNIFGTCAFLWITRGINIVSKENNYKTNFGLFNLSSFPFVQLITS